MSYCGNCHYNLVGLDTHNPCPECGAYDRLDKIPSRFLGKYSPVALSVYVFILTFALFSYGSGPPNIAGSGTITTNKIPTLLNVLNLLVAALSGMIVITKLDHPQKPTRFVVYAANFFISLVAILLGWFFVYSLL